MGLWQDSAKLGKFIAAVEELSLDHGDEEKSLHAKARYAKFRLKQQENGLETLSEQRKFHLRLNLTNGKWQDRIHQGDRVHMDGNGPDRIMNVVRALCYIKAWVSSAKADSSDRYSPLAIIACLNHCL